MAKNKKKGTRNNTTNITDFVFGKAPNSEAKTNGDDGSFAGKVQASSSSPDVSVTLNSVDTISAAEESSSSTTHGGKKHHDATRFQRNANRTQVTPPTNANNRSPDEGFPLQKVEVGDKVAIPVEGYPALEEDWGFCLVGCFTGRFPGIKAIENLVSSWHVESKFLPHERGWVLFQFTSDEDRRIVLQNGPYTLFGKTLLLRILPQDFRFNFDAFMTVDVWVKFVNVPLRCWNKIALEHLGSRVGTPKRTDQGTKQRGRISFCRMLIQVDMSKELPTSFEVSLPDGGEYTQKVVYEGLPKYCFHCKRFGHNLFDCRVLRALRLRKSGDFEAKHAGVDRQMVEGNTHSTSGGRRANQPRTTRPVNSVTEDGNPARPKSSSQPRRSKSANTPSSHAVLGVEDTLPDPSTTPMVEETVTDLVANRRKKKKQGSTPCEAGTSGLPCSESSLKTAAVGEDKGGGMETLDGAAVVRKPTPQQPPPEQQAKTNKGMAKAKSSTKQTKAKPSAEVAHHATEDRTGTKGKSTAVETVQPGTLTIMREPGQAVKCIAKEGVRPFEAMPYPRPKFDYMDAHQWDMTKDSLERRNRKIADEHQLHKELAEFNISVYGDPDGSVPHVRC